jgi:hypothetical protein
MNNPVKLCRVNGDMYHCDMRFGTRLNPVNLHAFYLDCGTVDVKHADSATVLSRADNVFTMRVSAECSTHTTNVTYNKATNEFENFEYSPCVLIPPLLSSKVHEHYFKCCQHPNKTDDYKTVDDVWYQSMCEQRAAERAVVREVLQVLETVADPRDEQQSSETAAEEPADDVRVVKKKTKPKARANNVTE